MKICLISFDFWDYDKYIVEQLKSLGVEAVHIKLGAFSHKNFKEKLTNAFSKVFLGKNLKHLKRQEFVKQTLDKIGVQDQILVLNADTLDFETIEFAKQHSKRLITYLYDNLQRFPVQEKLPLFDKVFSFDDKDITEHGFERLSNYNYLPKLSGKVVLPKRDLFYITSYDNNRNALLKRLSEVLKKRNILFQFVVVGKKTWIEHFDFFSKIKLKNIANLQRKPIKPAQNLKEYKLSKAILDLARKGQTGLSFRVFEAMALEKKLITDNKKIMNYEFYNPNNILVLEEDFSNLNSIFFESPYQKLPIEIFEKYSLASWVKKVFDL